MSLAHFLNALHQGKTMSNLEFVRVEDRRIIDGPVDKLMQPSPVKYRKPIEIMEKGMRDNWFHWDVNLNDDLGHFRQLDPKSRRAVQKDLGFLSNLDGIQLNTLANSIGRYITTPEYRMGIVRQTYEEEIHVLTYDRMITSLEMDPIETYNLFLTDEILKGKNEHIIKMAELLGDDYSGENFVRAIAANQALEGIYFQFGFRVFYVIHKRGMMGGCAKNIRYIQRDEGSHLRLFNAMWHDLRAERPELFTPAVLKDCKEILRQAALMEMQWGKHIIEGGILGLTNQVVDGNVMFTTNQVANSVGLGDVFENVRTDPMAWTDAYLREHGIETNFFEDKVIEYEDRSIDW